MSFIYRFFIGNSCINLFIFKGILICCNNSHKKHYICIVVFNNMNATKEKFLHF